MATPTLIPDEGGAAWAPTARPAAVRRADRLLMRGVVMVSKSDLQAELDLSLICLGCCDLSETGATEGSIWVAEMWRVGEIESFEAELRSHSLRDGETAKSREIKVGESRTGKNIAADVAVGSRRWR